MQSEPYQQLAWWNLVIASAQGEPKWWAQRGRCCGQSGAHNGSLTKNAARNFERAIALAPDDPRAYEACAKFWSQGNWWNLAPESRSATANYLQAIQLRIASGQIDGTSALLCEQGDQQLQRSSSTDWISPEYCFARAYAFYILALSADPTDAALHLKCAQALEASPLNTLLHFGKGQTVTARAAFEHYARALQMDNRLEAARAGVVTYLTRELQQTTAHERIEALLRERQRLLDFGLGEALAREIIAEVERALAA